MVMLKMVVFMSEGELVTNFQRTIKNDGYKDGNRWSTRMTAVL